MPHRFAVLFATILMASATIIGSSYATTITSAMEHSQGNSDLSHYNNGSLPSTTRTTITSPSTPSSSQSNTNSISEKSDSTSKTGSSSDLVNNQKSSSSSTSPSPQKSSAAETMTPKLDGIGRRTGEWWNSALLSTTQSNDVIIATTFCFTANTPGGTACLRGTTITDTAGLTFVEHSKYCHVVNGTYYYKSPNPIYGAVASSCVRDYYAIATMQLHNDNITSSDLRMTAFALSGADTGNVFKASFPVGADCPALDHFGDPSNMYSSSPCTVNFENQQHDFVFALTSVNDAPACSSGMSDWDWNTLMSNNTWFEVDFSNNPSTHSFSCTAENSEPTVLMVDAVQGATK